MDKAKSQQAKVLVVKRGFERCRVQYQLVAAAYGLAAPIIRRRLPTSSGQGRGRRSNYVCNNRQPVHGGLSA